MSRRDRFNPEAILRFTFDAKANAALIYLAKNSPGDIVSCGIVDRQHGPILD